jgi:hypothetical protein
VIRKRSLSGLKLVHAGAKALPRNALSPPSESRPLRRSRSLNPTLVVEQVHTHGASLSGRLRPKADAGFARVCHVNVEL